MSASNRITLAQARKQALEAMERAQREYRECVEREAHEEEPCPFCGAALGIQAEEEQP